MTLAGPCYLYRWCNALHSLETDHADSITVEETEPLLWISDGRPGPATEGSDKPEGLEVQLSEGRLLAWVAYGDPTVARRRGQEGARTRLDAFVVAE